MKRTKVVISYLKCSVCGYVASVPRKIGKQRENNHIKDMYCPFCKKVEKFKEDQTLRY